jgi:RNA polymerase sigma-70 factor, ECF subfamily
MPDDTHPMPAVEIGWHETVARVRAYVRRRVADDETAADITQDVLVRRIAAGDLAHVDNPIGWLYRAAHNAVIDHYRTRRLHAPLADAPPEPDLTADNGPNAATRGLARCLQPLVQQLPPQYREAVTRVDLDGQTHARAADELGISVSGMKSRVQRGRRQLKQLLTRCCAVHQDRAGAVSGYKPADATCGCRST